MIIYSNFVAGLHPAIKQTPGLVLGWTTADLSAGTETCYALCADGTVLQTFPGPISPCFAKGRRWVRGTTIPGDAAYIGAYLPPAH